MRRADQDTVVPEVALYLHIPFCRTRCSYCGFNTYAGLEHRISDYVEALCREIQDAPFARARTVYFGGGTPSLLSLEGLTRLLVCLRGHFLFPEDVEITLEANPGTVGWAYLQGLRDLGVNRLSLGVQSVHPEELRLLGRLHTWADAVGAFQMAREARFENLNVDLIYGIPGQTMARWQRSVESVLQLEPDHLSLYALTLEEGTPLASQVARGLLPSPDDDLAAEMYEWARERLREAGYIHYELSNWARSESRMCRHNLTYWHNEPYLGFGAGAASWWSGRRWTNVRHPEEYIHRIERGFSVADEVEEISQELEMAETMMMGLRLIRGVSDERFRARFGVGLEEAFGDQLRRFVRAGLLEWDGRVARLTPRGHLLGNQVFQAFLP
ncbi:MAG: radical SAM family heme chaperone HemW [Anaerolineae bacterium]|nr:radical SAM family heme chaperone HemW [Anaerolineae bacterium]